MKNFLIISPNYPGTYYKFCSSLKALGFNVFGIGDAGANDLNPELSGTLTEYVQVHDLRNYGNLLDAAKYITGKYGSLTGIESNNENWLENDAKLRCDLGIEGLKPDKLECYQYKSKMKKLFHSAGVAAVPFVVARTIQQVQEFVNQYGFPIFAKPNKGVGARDVCKITCSQELENFFMNAINEDFIFELYIEGNLYSYDGMTDKQGNIIFEAAHRFDSPIDKLKQTGTECIYYTLRTIPEKLLRAGRNTVKKASLSGRFFHIEFFELTKPMENIGKEGDFLGVEVNMRPAGGYTPEMMNHAKDVNVYDLWAECVVKDTVPVCRVSNNFFCINIGRHSKKQYRHSITQIQEKYSDRIVFAGMTEARDNPYGNYEVIAKFESLEKSKDFCAYVTAVINENQPI